MNHSMPGCVNMWKFTVHILLKAGLENFEHYFTSMGDECNCAVVWAFFGIVFLWQWNENWPGTPTPGVHSNSCPLSQWCHPTISSSVVPFSSCLQSFPASGSFPMSQIFTSGGQSTGVSASTSVLPMNTQDWSPLGISLQSKWLSSVFSNTTVQKHQFFGTQLSL